MTIKDKIKDRFEKFRLNAIGILAIVNTTLYPLEEDASQGPARYVFPEDDFTPKGDSKFRITSSFSTNNQTFLGHRDNFKFIKKYVPRGDIFEGDNAEQYILTERESKRQAKIDQIIYDMHDANEFESNQIPIIDLRVPHLNQGINLNLESFRTYNSDGSGCFGQVPTKNKGEFWRMQRNSSEGDIYKRGIDEKNFKE